MKVAGGRPAVAKRVTAELDSDDETIMRLKNAKFLEKDIAQILVEQGRIAYNPKTIGTRHARIMKALAEQHDQMLDEELTDWHDGDVSTFKNTPSFNSLIPARITPLSKLSREPTLRSRRCKKPPKGRGGRLLHKTSRRLRYVDPSWCPLHSDTLQPVVNFSQLACRNRYEDLMRGTAKPTPESVPDPDENVKKRIESRLEKEKRIEEDVLWKQQLKSNLDGNGWTSRAVKYF